MILITVALPFESAGLRKKVRRPDVKFFHTGVGPKSAGVRMEAFWKANAKPGLVISTGFAGALNPDYRVGDLVIGTNYSTVPIEPPSGPGPVVWKSGSFLTVDAIVSTAENKRMLRQDTGADAVDMETEAIWHACQAAGVPMVAIRVISDAAGEDLSLPPRLLRALSDSPVTGVPELLLFLLAHPGRISGFGSFVRDCRRAQDRLAAGISLYLAGQDNCMSDRVSRC